MTHLQVLVIILVIMAVLYCLYCLVDRLLVRALPNQPPRVVVPDEGTDLGSANDFFHPTGAASTAMAAARILPDEKSETRTVAAAGSRTTKGATQ